MNQSEGKLIKVLIVDDDKEDIDLTLEVLKLSKLKLTIEMANDGIEAMNYLNETYAKNPEDLPDLILLDLNMPRKNGHEVLSEIKSSKNLRKIPVVILTTSSAESDISKSYDSGTNCYITKPVGLDQFQEVVQAVNNFWFTVVKLPEKEN